MSRRHPGRKQTKNRKAPAATEKGRSTNPRGTRGRQPKPKKPQGSSKKSDVEAHKVGGAKDVKQNRVQETPTSGRPADKQTDNFRARTHSQGHVKSRCNKQGT